MSVVAEKREQFLYTPVMGEGSSRMVQSKIAPLRGVEWFCRQILREVTSDVIEQAEMYEGVAEWEDWGAEEVQIQVRSSTEEGRLWKILEEIDILDAKNIKAKQKREAMKVAKARSKMGASKEIPTRDKGSIFQE